MTSLSDGLGPKNDPEQRPDPQGERVGLGQAGAQAGDVGPSPDEEMDERFKRCPCTPAWPK